MLSYSPGKMDFIPGLISKNAVIGVQGYPCGEGRRFIFCFTQQFW